MTQVIDEPVIDKDKGTLDLWQRVCAEYLEMPGLQLTLPQACRLLNTNPEVGRHVLDSLVDSAFLRRSGAHYVRADSPWSWADGVAD
jgi:hypothetical protein